MATVSLSASPTIHGTATVTLATHAATTAYVVQIVSPSGRTQSIPVTTDGSGAATVTFVPQREDRGVITVKTVLAATPAATATTTGTLS